MPKTTPINTPSPLESEASAAGQIPLNTINLEFDEHESAFENCVLEFLRGRTRLALTGAGISVESGIPDFRSKKGLWETYPPQEYATLETFLETPEKSWQLFREIGETLKDATPNAAHKGLARLESHGLLDGVITQNIDHLHQVAGSRQVYDIHGTFRRLHCPNCGWTQTSESVIPSPSQVPSCPRCESSIKPDVVLFGENVKHLHRIEPKLKDCDVMLVIGTSAEVYPAAGFPAVVKAQGGLVIEFNLSPTRLSSSSELGRASAGADRLLLGSATKTMSKFAERAIERSRS